MALYKFNESFFEKIDNEEKAYWLGFMFADGCVYTTVSNGYTRRCISIQLAVIDYVHLKKFLNSIEGNNNLYYFKRTHYTGVVGEYVCLILSSEKMYKDLVNWGCTPRKSKNIIYPNIDDDLNNHFIRGFFDGDGSVFTRKREKENREQITIKFVANYRFLDSINKILGLNGSIRISNKNVSDFYQLTVSGNKKTKPFIDYIYKDSKFYLDRKKNLIDEHFNKYYQMKQISEKKNYFAFGDFKSLNKWSIDERCSVSHYTIRRRLKNGWHIEKAITEPLVKWKKK